jgi:hypothetical protein
MADPAVPNVPSLHFCYRCFQVWHRLATRSCWSIQTWLVGPIWEAWKGFAVTNVVSWHQTSWNVAQIILRQVLNISPSFSSRSGMSWHRLDSTRSCWPIQAWLIGPIWETWKGLAATDVMSWHQTTRDAAQIILRQSLNISPSIQLQLKLTLSIVCIRCF